MNSRIILTVIGLLSTTLPCHASDLYKIEATVSPDHPKLGKGILVRFEFVNLSGHSVLIWNTGSAAENDYQLALVRSDGRVAQRMPQLTRVGNAGHTELEPNEAHVEQLDLTKVFLIKEPGSYVLTASRLAPDGSSTSSPPITIDVSP